MNGSIFGLPDPCKGARDLVISDGVISFSTASSLPHIAYAILIVPTAPSSDISPSMIPLRYAGPNSCHAVFLNFVMKGILPSSSSAIMSPAFTFTGYIAR